MLISLLFSHNRSNRSPRRFLIIGEKEMLNFLCQVSHPHSTCDIPQKVQNYINAGSKHIETTESGHMTLEAAELQIVEIYCGLQWFLQLPKFLKTPYKTLEASESRLWSSNYNQSCSAQFRKEICLNGSAFCFWSVAL